MMSVNAPHNTSGIERYHRHEALARQQESCMDHTIQHFCCLLLSIFRTLVFVVCGEQ